MYMIHQIALYVHIAIGACALILFWIPVFARKGNLDHKRFGRYFAMAMYTVSCSGIVMSILDLIWPILTHTSGVVPEGTDVAQFKTSVRAAAIFLLSLSVLVLVSARQGWLAIQYGADRTMLRKPGHLLLCVSLVTVGLILLLTGLMLDILLFVIFATLEIVAGSKNIHYIFKSELKPGEWWKEHFSGLIGAGIGAYTAFLVFGGSRLFSSLFGDVFEQVSIILWVTPGVIGAIAIMVLSRRYDAKFSGDWAIRRARSRVQFFARKT